MLDTWLYYVPWGICIFESVVFMLDGGLVVVLIAGWNEKLWCCMSSQREIYMAVWSE